MNRNVTAANRGGNVTVVDDNHNVNYSETEPEGHIMPTPRKYEDAATKQAAYRIRKEKERLALGAAILDLGQAVGQARTHGPVQVALGDIRTDDHAGLVRGVAQAIREGTETAKTKRGQHERWAEIPPILAQDVP